jgi:hypothetical protein
MKRLSKATVAGSFATSEYVSTFLEPWHSCTQTPFRFKLFTVLRRTHTRQGPYHQFS